MEQENKDIDIYEEINILKGKIEALEKDNQFLMNEIKGKNNINQNNDIKNQENFEIEMKNNFENFKNEIYKSLMDIKQDSTKTDDDNLIKLNIDYTKDKENINSIENKYESFLNENIKAPAKNKYLIINNLKSKSNSFDKKVLLKGSSPCISEKDKENVKLLLLEKQINSMSMKNYSDMKNINKNINILKNFKDVTNISLQNFHKDFQHNVNNNKLFISEISKIIENFQEKLNIYEKRLNEPSIIIKNILEGPIMEKFNKDMNEVNLNLQNQNKEIENFEKFMSIEHEKFIQFIQNNFDKSICSIKQLFDINNEEIKKSNDKFNSIVEMIKKVRNDVYKSINDSELFFENKYQSLFRLIKPFEE